MTAVIAAIASVVGYIGAEVAEESLFERILWPQRFYNYLDLPVAAKLIILMPMGGPLHRAALGVLDRFRLHGLYSGRAAGDPLGTSFFSDSKLSYVRHTAEQPEDQRVQKQARNGFWIEVLRNIDPRLMVASPPSKADLLTNDKAAAKGHVPREVRRKKQYLYRLRLENTTIDRLPKSSTVTQEDCTTAWTVVGIVLSELASIGIAVVISVVGNYYAITVLLALPVVLKLLALLFSVRRETFMEDLPFATPDPTPSEHVEPKEPAASASLTLPSSQAAPVQPNIDHAAAADATAGTASADNIGLHSTYLEQFEVLNSNLGIILLESSRAETVLQFTRHYGHPLRAAGQDRLREVISIAIVYAFILQFPAGLVALAWAPDRVQLMWLGYQIYAIVAMHLARLVGWTGCGRTEERLARLLERDGIAYLGGGDRVAVVSASLEVEQFAGVREAEKRKSNILIATSSSSNTK